MFHFRFNNLLKSKFFLLFEQYVFCLASCFLIEKCDARNANRTNPR